MLIGTACTHYGALEPDLHTALQRTSLALRRGGVQTTEQLQALYLVHPEKLEKLRDIGPKRMELIRQVLLFCRDLLPESEGRS